MTQELPPEENRAVNERAVPELDETLSLEALAAKIMAQRAEALQAVAPSQAPEVPPQKGPSRPVRPRKHLAVAKPERPNTGGAFGGALARRIAQSDDVELLTTADPADVDLLAPHHVTQQLFEREGDQTFQHVLLTPAEVNAVTWRPATLAQRVGSRVLKGTADRPATVRHARKAEVIVDTLQTRQQLVGDRLLVLNADMDAATTLCKEMRTPGFAHMSGSRMDGLMAGTEKIFDDMLVAIIENRGTLTAQEQSLRAALKYLLSSNEYKQTFTYWRKMTDIAIKWTALKIDRFTEVDKAVNNELYLRLRDVRQAI